MNPIRDAAYLAELCLRADDPRKSRKWIPIAIVLCAIGLALTFAGLFGNRASYFDC
jgi:hypothetical protein